MRLGNEFAEALGSECTSICYHLEEVTVAVHHAVPFGLIFNELISNAFKRAFPIRNSARPLIQIKLTPAGIVTIVKDSGIHCPPTSTCTM